MSHASDVSATLLNLRGRVKGMNRRNVRIRRQSAALWLRRTVVVRRAQATVAPDAAHMAAVTSRAATFLADGSLHANGMWSGDSAKRGQAARYIFSPAAPSYLHT